MDKCRHPKHPNNLRKLTKSKGISEKELKEEVVKNQMKDKSNAHIKVGDDNYKLLQDKTRNTVSNHLMLKNSISSDYQKIYTEIFECTNNDLLPENTILKTDEQFKRLENLPESVTKAL